MYQRIASIDRGVINMETGEFPATLFTDGEASDGHILDIAGAEIPERMPMFVNHDADPTMQLGSIIKATRTAHEIKVVGHIEMEGDSALGDIRRDVALMMSRGHVSQMSGKWDADQGATKRRSDLPREHFAYAKAGGMYFGRWAAMEGSIVGLGADPKAVVGRASDVELPDHVRAFWRAFHAEQEETGLDASLAEAMARLHESGELVALLPQSLIEQLRAPAPETVAITPAHAAPVERKAAFDLEEMKRIVHEHDARFEERMRENVRELFLRTLGSVIK